MKNLRECFLTKDFIINSNIIKYLSTIDINLDEFLLIIYFINISSSLDLDSIKEKLGLPDDRVYSAFNSLINKKYIELKVTSNKDKLDERVVLDPFYDKLALNNEIQSNNSDIFALYECELGRTLNSFEYETINRWISDSISEDIITGALKEAISNGITNFKYIDKIVYEWNKNGIKKKAKDNLEEGYTEIYSFNWLDDNAE